MRKAVVQAIAVARASSDGPTVRLILVAAVVARAAFMLAVQPISYGLNDSGTYLAAASGAAPSLFYDVHHAVGYSIFLDVVAPLVNNGTGLAIVQHLLGIGATALIFQAARGFGAPRWAAAIPAVGYALSLDVIALEHSVLSEAVYLPLVALVVFAASRIYRSGNLKGVLVWAAVMGAGAGAAYTVRYPGLALCVLAPLAAAVLPRVRLRHRPVSAAVAAVGVLVVGGSYVIAQDRATGIGLVVLPGLGWNAYAAIAPDADCSRFTPPPGTRVLCEPAAARRGKTPEFYSWSGTSPARRLEPRGFPYSDDRFRAFADAAAPSVNGPARGHTGRTVLPFEAQALPLMRSAGIVFGPLGWAPELNYRNVAVEKGERKLAAGLIDLRPMSFHAPLQPLMDLRPFLRVTGSMALIAAVLALLALPRLGYRRALFVLLIVGVVLAWINAGTLPRYAVPIYELCIFLVPLAVAGFSTTSQRRTDSFKRPVSRPPRGANGAGADGNHDDAPIVVPRRPE
jgi:hypothetical protein